MDEKKKREIIKKIRLDKNLSDQEKNKKIQEIFTLNYVNLNQPKSNMELSCSHYEKKCSKFKFSCCGLIDPCKRCHISRDCCNYENIKIKLITCNLCGLEQEPTDTCANLNCGIKFSTSYCDQCQIWTSKEITHCVDCGICRIGTKETLYHCVECGTCFNVGGSTNLSHQCNNNNGIKTKWNEGYCVVCREHTFNSQSAPVCLPCSHLIHQTCYTQYIQQSNYKCPCCKKSICDLTPQWDFIRSQIKLHPIPNEMIPIELEDIVDTPFGKFKILKIKTINRIKLFKGEFISWFVDINSKFNVKATLNHNFIKKNIYKNIHCNDCGKKSTSQFHFYGLECIECGSFNTQE